MLNRLILGFLGSGVDQDGGDLPGGVVADKGEGFQRFAFFQEAAGFFDKGQDDVQIGLG